MTDAFPLSWPDGWPRTPAADLKDGRYNFRRPPNRNPSPFWTFADARDALLNEIRLLNGGGPTVISSNFRTDRRGLPVEARQRPLDQGVAVYFDLGGRQMSMARDAYTRAEENMRSLALAIDAMRALERHGGSMMMNRAFSGFAALPPPQSCWSMLGLAPGATEQQIRSAWRAAAATAGAGNEPRLKELNVARDEALRAAMKG